MKHISLFSGIGGFDLAAEWMGWENVAHCEWNPFGQKVLKYYWPNAISYHDITKTDFTIHRGNIDIITGGFPCQPYSLAGQRKGKEDERHLWPEMLRAIREVQPCWVVGENVRGLINWSGGLVFDEVQSDLENEGYEVTPFLLPACAVDAPHRRDRIWFVAFNANSRASDGNGAQQTVYDTVENTHSIGVLKNDATYTSNSGLQGSEVNGSIKGFGTVGNKQSAGRIPPDWKEFPTQSPICDGNDGIPTGLLRQLFREDSLGVISEEEIDKILSQAYGQWRNESIKAGGNAIVPQIAHQIFKAIQQYESL